MTTTPSARPAPRHGYSSLQIALHWTIMVLVVANTLLGQPMERVYEAIQAGEDLETYGPAYVHVAIGTTVFLLMLMRLVVRINRPVQTAADSPHRTLALLGRINHWAFYVALIGSPILGMLAWFGGIEAAGELHALANYALLALIALHVGGVIVHHLLRDPILHRMLRGGGGT